MPGRSAVEVNIENERSTSIEKDYLGDWSPEKDCCLWLTFRQPVRKQSSVTLKMASAQVVETTGTSNSPSQDSNQPDDLFDQVMLLLCSSHLLIRDLLLCVHVVVKTLNLEISRHLADHVREYY